MSIVRFLFGGGLKELMWGNPLIWGSCLLVFLVPIYFEVRKFGKLAKKQKVSIFKLLFSNKYGNKKG